MASLDTKQLDACFKVAGFNSAQKKEILNELTRASNASSEKGKNLAVFRMQYLTNDLIPRFMTRADEQISAYVEEVRKARAGGATVAVTGQDSAAVPPAPAAEGAPSAAPTVPVGTTLSPVVGAPPTAARPTVEARVAEKAEQRNTILRAALGAGGDTTVTDEMVNFASASLEGTTPKAAYERVLGSILDGAYEDRHQGLANDFQNQAAALGLSLDDVVADFKDMVESARVEYEQNKPQNLSRAAVISALSGKGEENATATRRVLRGLAAKIKNDQRRLNTAWKETFLPALEAAQKTPGFTEPAWFGELRNIVGASQGGSVEENAARRQALLKLAASFNAEGDTIAETRQARAKAVLDAFTNSKQGSQKESDSDARTRILGIKQAVDDALRTADEAAAKRVIPLSEKVERVGGEDTNAGRLLYVLSKINSKTYGKVLSTIRFAEVLMRAGRFAEAVRELKGEAAIEKTSLGTEGVEDTREIADESTVSLSEVDEVVDNTDSIIEAIDRARAERAKLLAERAAQTKAAAQLPGNLRGARFDPRTSFDSEAFAKSLGGKPLRIETEKKAVSRNIVEQWREAVELPPGDVVFGAHANDAEFDQMLREGGMSEGQLVVWTKLRSLAENTPVLFVRDSVFNELAGDDATSGLFLPRRAAQIRKVGGPTGFILLPESMIDRPDANYRDGAAFTETFLHEVAHALTYASVSTNTDLRARLQSLIDVAKTNARAMVGKANRDAFTDAELEALQYAASSPDEFLAMAFTSPEVQSALAKIPLTEANREALGIAGKAANVWKAFVDFVRRALNLSGSSMSILEGVIAMSDDAFMTVEQQRAALQANPQLKLVEQGMRALSWPRAMTNTFPDGARRAAINSGGRLRRLGLAFSTLRQIMFNSEDLFARTAALDAIDPNDKRSPVAVVVQSYLRRAQMAVDLLNGIVMGPLRAMRALPKASREKVSEFLLDTTLYEVHPDEPIGKGTKNEHVLDMKDAKKKAAEAAHKRLAAQFATFSPEEQAAYKSVVKSMETAHARVIRSIVGSIVTRWYTSLVEKNLRDPKTNPLPTAEIAAAGGPVQFVEGLIQRAYNRTLTQAESVMLGDDVFKMLETAHARSKMKGPYVPLQRFGDWVVRWNETEPETKVFDTEAERDAYTAASGLQLRGERKIFLDANGNEITTADPAIEQAEIGKAKSALPPTATTQETDAAVAKAKRAALKETIKQKTATTKYEITQQTKGVAFFESEAEAAEAVENLRSDGKQNVKEYDLRKNPKERASLLEDADFNKMKEAIEGDDSLTPAAKEKAIAALEQAMLMVVPNRALNASMVRRRKVIGADKNVTRAIANYGIAMANYASSIDTAIPITLGLKAMNDYTSEQAEIQPGAESTKTTARRREYIREVEERVLYNPLDTGGSGLAGPVIRKLQAMTYVYFLASPSYVMIQMTQPWLLTMPILSGQYGVARTTAAMTRANADIGLSKLARGGAKDTAAALRALVTGKEAEKEPLLDYVKANLTKAPDGKRLLEMVESLSKEGLLDGDAGMEIIRAEVSEDGPIGRFIGRAEVLSRALPAMVEVINRSSSAVAAYRLEYAKSGDHEAAIRKAYEVVDQSQGDYAAANTARFMDPRRYPLLSPMMTFRKYAQAVYALLIRQVMLSVKGKDLETRRNAQKTLAMVLMAHASVAGVLGLPTEAFTLLLGITAFLLGSKEPWDWEQMFRQEAAKLFGKEAAEVLARGLPRYMGVDLSGRLGLNSLLFMHDLRDFEKKTTNEYIGQLLIGAPGGMVLNAMDSWQQINKAIGSDKPTDYTKAIEGLLPKGFRDPLRAWRVSEEGVTTRRGERIDEGRQATAGETAVQALGFTPAAQAEVYERRNAVQGLNRKMTAERSDLMRKWRQAEPEGRQRIWREIVEWNQKLEPGMRGFRVTRENLIQSLAESRRRERSSQQGDYLPRGREGLRREGEFANTRSER